MKARLLVGVATLILTASPLLAQECDTEVTIGKIPLRVRRSHYDGAATTFRYCVNRPRQPGFHALSNWEMNLDIACISPEDLVGCGPEPCFYQVDDPHTASPASSSTTWKSTRVRRSATRSRSPGTGPKRIDNVSAGLKAGLDIEFRPDLRPELRELRVAVAYGSEAGHRQACPSLHLFLAHNKPVDANTPVRIVVRDSAGNLFHKWESKTMKFTEGAPLEIHSAIPGMPLPPPGVYTVRVLVKAMAGWVGKETTFEVLAP
jgi:hypothetical protein